MVKTSQTRSEGLLAERSVKLLDSLEMRRQELERVMTQHPTLTCSGLAWFTDTDSKGRHDLPDTPEEQEAYREQRNTLIHEVMTKEECTAMLGPNHEGYNGVKHYGEIPLALRYLTLCQHSQVQQAYSYSVKHRAEKIGNPHYVSNGSMIAVTLMAGGRMVQEEIYGRPGMNAYLWITEPKLCGSRGVRHDSGCQDAMIPAGNRNRLCDDCRQKTNQKR